MLAKEKVTIVEVGVGGLCCVVFVLMFGGDGVPMLWIEQRCKADEELVDLWRMKLGGG